jgi:hypothetical protein
MSSTDWPVSRISRSCSVGGCQQFGRRGFHLRVVCVTRVARVLHVADQHAQFFHRVVHRVGDGAGDVFGHGGFLRQVALGHRLQLVHQTQMAAWLASLTRLASCS